MMMMSASDVVLHSNRAPIMTMKLDI